MAYKEIKFAGYSMQSFSVPPNINKTLDDKYYELNKFQFYFGNNDLTPIIDLINDSSLEEIEKLKKHIVYLAKEIQNGVDDLRRRYESNDLIGITNEINEDNIKNIKEIIKKIYSNPTKKNNLLKLNNVLEYQKEIIVFSKMLGINTDYVKDEINENLLLIKNLKEAYPQYKDVKNFEIDEIKELEIKEKITNQIKNNIPFDMQEIYKIYVDNDNYVSVLNVIDAEQKNINEKDYKFNNQDSENDKKIIVSQLTAINNMFNYGVINEINYELAIMNNKLNQSYNNQLIKPTDLYNIHLKQVEKYNLKNVNTKEHFDKLYDNNNIETVELYNNYKNINKNLISIINENVKNNEIIFEGNWDDNYVTAKFNDNKIFVVKQKYRDDDKVTLIIVNKENINKFEEELKNNLELDLDDLENKSIIVKKCDFQSYSKMIIEINQKEIEFFFDGKFDFVDNTNITTKKLKIK